jgi:DNA invertase Pin-like site-specific DNA recombinase
MNPKITLPLDVYVRVSDVRGRSGDSFVSPKDQEERCRALAKARGYRVGEVFTDLDKSGGTMDRPAFNKALTRIRDGASGGIIVARMDRFARTLTGAIATLEEIETAGGYLIECDGDWDTSTPMGRFGRDLVIRLAQLYREQIADSWVTSKRHAVERGIHISRHPPLGYIRGADGRLAFNPARVEAVREAFALAAAREPYARIADYLTEQGIPTPSNRVRRMLQNRAYLGEARNGHGDINPSAHPALVDEVTWNLAQRKQADTPTLTKNVENLLSGLVRCSSCSFAMRPQAARGTTVATYRCTTVTAHGRCPGPSTISASRIEDYVVEQFLARIGETAFEQVATDDDEQKAAGLAIVAAERSYRSALTDLELREQIGDADHAQLIAKLHAQWQEALAAAPVPAPRPMAASVIDMSKLVERLRSEEDVKGLREILGSAIAAVFVRPAASRAKALPVSDRVRVVFHDEEPSLELPRRGASYEPRAYNW